MEYSDNENGSDCDDLIDDILGPENLFDQEADEDGHDGGDEDEDVPEKTEVKEKAEKKPKPKRIVKNPRVTLNYDTLKGVNGLSALKKHFKDFKFKGSNHEEEDLTKIMRILQHWMCYQLCPKYDFESCMTQLEKLGKKRVVQTLMKKYRMGMDDWGENKSDNENENQVEITEETNQRNNTFDLLLDEHILGVDSDNEMNQSVTTPSQNDVTQTQQTQNDTMCTLTPEQLERIARNKRLAEEKRRLRMSSQIIDGNKEADNVNNADISLEKMNLEESSY